MSEAREQQVQAWLAREQEALARQRRESRAMAEAWARCEAGDGHVVASVHSGVGVCAVCLNRIPQP